MKKYVVLSVILASVITVVGLGACSSGGLNAAAGVPLAIGTNGTLSVVTGDPQSQGIWVSGTGKVTVVPDIAVINLGVSAQATNVAAAQAQATEAMNKVMAALKEAGVADKDIKTTSYSIQQVTRWDNDKNEETVTGYRVSNMVSVKVRVIDKAGTVIDAVATAGGNAIRINGISLTVDNPEAYFSEARGKAMADAKARAEQLASLAGVQLGMVTYITENSGYYPPPTPVYYERAAMGMDSSTPISAGETEISLTVQVAYAIAQ